MSAQSRLEQMNSELLMVGNDYSDVLLPAAQEIATLTARLAALRDFVQEQADEDCGYGDNCTSEAMRLRRHGMCQPCKAREAITKSDK